MTDMISECHCGAVAGIVPGFTGDAGGASARTGGGIMWDLGGHMLDQVTWLMGRPVKVTASFQFTQQEAPQCADNTLAVMEFAGGGIGIVDIAARQMNGHRRFEVFGTLGTAIIVEVGI